MEQKKEFKKRKNKGRRNKKRWNRKKKETISAKPKEKRQVVKKLKNSDQGKKVRIRKLCHDSKRKARVQEIGRQKCLPIHYLLIHCDW